MQLPEDFIRYTREVMGEERFQRYLESFNEEMRRRPSASV